MCTEVTNVVAIRPKGYIGISGQGSTPPAGADEFSSGPSIEALDGVLRAAVLEKLKLSNSEISEVWSRLLDEREKADMDEEAFGYLLDQLEVSLTEEERHSLFLLMDNNHDGVISKDEAAKWKDKVP